DRRLQRGGEGRDADPRRPDQRLPAAAGSGAGLGDRGRGGGGAGFVAALGGRPREALALARPAAGGRRPDDPARGRAHRPPRPQPVLRQPGAGADAPGLGRGDPARGRRRAPLQALPAGNAAAARGRRRHLRPRRGALPRRRADRPARLERGPGRPRGAQPRRHHGGAERRPAGDVRAPGNRPAWHHQRDPLQRRAGARPSWGRADARTGVHGRNLFRAGRPAAPAPLLHLRRLSQLQQPLPLVGPRSPGPPDPERLDVRHQPLPAAAGRERAAGVPAPLPDQERRNGGALSARAAPARHPARQLRAGRLPAGGRCGRIRIPAAPGEGNWFRGSGGGLSPTGLYPGSVDPATPPGDQPKTVFDRIEGLRWRLRATLRVWTPGSSPDLPMIEPPPVVPGPEGSLDIPAGGPVLRRGPVTLHGWSRFPSGPNSQVEVWLGEHSLGRGRIGVPRPDVTATLELAPSEAPGFELTTNLIAWPGEDGEAELRATASSCAGEHFEIEPLALKVAGAVALPSSPTPPRTPAVTLKPGLRTLIVAHQLDRGGAQLYLMDLLRELLRTEAINPTVVAGRDGALREELEALG